MNKMLSIFTRSIVAGTAMFCLAQTAEAVPYVRQDASSPDAKADLDAMRKAMDALRKTGCTTPASWYYQGAMHWVPKAPQNNNSCAYYQPGAALLTAWRNCASHEAGNPPKSEIHFLAWHRMYLYHFEKIVRKLSGYNNFALPYWNYTSSVGPQAMPAVFMQPTTNNSLYDASRNTVLNTGIPMDLDTYKNIIDDWNQVKQNSQFTNFNSELNNGLHGTMHVYIGAGTRGSSWNPPNWNPIYQQDTGLGLMASVPSAGFDPMFWLHHSNIDRLWQQWTDSPRGKKMTLAELESAKWPYVFFDENNNKVEYTMQQVNDILYKLDYRYNDQAQVVAEAQTLPPKPAKQSKVASSTVAQTVGAAGARFKLALPAEVRAVKAFALGAEPEKSVVLELTTSYQNLPRGVYNVYLNLPEGVSKEERRKYFIGSMSFFFNEPSAGEKGGAVFKFDLTDELANSVSAQDAGAGDVNISILNAFDGGKAEGITIEQADVYTYE